MSYVTTDVTDLLPSGSSAQWVRLLSGSQYYISRTQTDDIGTFVIHKVPNGTYTLGRSISPNGPWITEDSAYVVASNPPLGNAVFLGPVPSGGASDKNAVQNVITVASNAGGGLVLLQLGTYKGNQNEEVSVPGNVTFGGAGVDATVVQFSVNLGSTITGGSAPVTKNAVAQDLTVDGTNFANTQSGLTYRNVQDSRFRRVKVYNVPYWSIVGKFETGTPYSPSLYLEDVLFDRNNNVLGGGQDMSSFINLTYVHLKNTEWRNNTQFSTCLIYGSTITAVIDGIKFLGCRSAQYGLNTNAFFVSIRGLRADGGTHLAGGQVLHCSDFEDTQTEPTVSAVLYVSSAKAELSGFHWGQRQGATVGGNNGAVHVYEYYRTPISVAIPNAIAINQTTLTFQAPQTTPVGFVNGDSIMLDEGNGQYEVVTLSSGAGTATWTITAATKTHAAGANLQARRPADVAIHGGNIAIVYLDLTGISASCTLRMDGTHLANGDGSFGVLAMVNNSGLTLATTVNLYLEGVKAAGAVLFDYFGPAGQLITYQGFMKNCAVYGSADAGFGGSGGFRLSQTLKMLIHNNDSINGFLVGTPAVQFTASASHFKNNRIINTGALAALPTGTGGTPAVPATTVNITDTTMVDNDVYVTAGASTCAITKGGTLIMTLPAAGVGMYRKRYKENVSYAFTAAPTHVFTGGD